YHSMGKSSINPPRGTKTRYVLQVLWQAYGSVAPVFIVSKCRLMTVYWTSTIRAPIIKDTIRSLIGAARILIVLAPACAIHPAVAQSDNKPVTLGAIQVLQDEPNYLDFAAGAFNTQENQYST